MKLLAKILLSFKDTDDAKMILTISDVKEKLKLEKFKNGQEVMVQAITENKSNKQRAKLWAVINAIAEEVGETDINIYETVLERANALTDYLRVTEEASERVSKKFRYVKVLNQFTNDKGNKMVDIKVYYGISDMDMSETGKVIEAALNLASEVGIDINEEWNM